MSTREDTAVDRAAATPFAAVVSATVVRRLGRRRVEVVLDRSEEVSAQVRLVRHDDVLVATCSGSLSPGRSTVRARVPKRVAAGHARVLVDVTGPDGVLTVAPVKVWVPGR